MQKILHAEIETGCFARGWDFDAAQFSPAQSPSSTYGLCFVNLAPVTVRELLIDSRVKSKIMNDWVVQPRPSFTANLLEKYAALPLYLRARIEGWNVISADLKTGNYLQNEQVCSQIRSHHCLGLIELDHADLRRLQRLLEGNRGRRQGNARRSCIQ